MFKTKNIFLLSFLIFNSAFLISFAQINMVQNPSFETYTMCPTGLDQMNYCTNWSSYRGSPDYYNVCGTSGMSPPNCLFGFQYPNSGNAYAGICTFYGPVTGYREITGSALMSSLTIGQKYFISFYVNMGGKSYKIGTDKIGIRFSTVPFSTITPAPINNFSHYYTSSIITDTTNWVQLKGSFIADSVYKYIMLGNFFNDVNTNTISIGFGNQSSYYYVDDVCVSTDSVYAGTWTGIKTNQSNIDKIRIYPNPSSDNLNFDFIGCLPKKIVFHNNTGKLVLEKIIADNEETLNIDLTSIPDGIYNLSIEYINGIENKKIIIINP